MGVTHYPSRPSYAQHAVQGASSIYLFAKSGLSHGDDISFDKIREGMTVVSNLPSSQHEENDRTVILKIFSSIGRCRFLDEKHFDACTALSGSGPAFVCIFLEAMTDGGVMMGLPRAEALELAAQSEKLAYMSFHG